MKDPEAGAPQLLGRGLRDELGEQPLRERHVEPPQPGAEEDGAHTRR